MRKILFRAKRKDNGEWVQGLLWKKKHNTNKIFISCFPDEDDNEESFVVIPKTVGQYTGLTDKNGEKSFEGDIVAGAVHWLERPKNGLVAFRNGSFGLIWFREDVELFHPFTSMCNIEYEVIGNIHDNPELWETEGVNDGRHYNRRA